MRTHLTWLAALLLSPWGLYAGEIPAPFVAEYQLSRAGLALAKVEVSLAPDDDGHYLYRAATHPIGLLALVRKDHIVEESLWRPSAQGLIPLRYRYRHEGGKKKRDVTLDFQWDRGQVINTAKGKPWKMPVQPGVLDKFLIRLAMMVDLKDGKTRFEYPVADGGRLKHYVFQAQSEETLKTRLGKLKTIKVTGGKQGRKPRTTLWCAPELEYLPVQVEREDDGAIYRMHILSLRHPKPERPNLAIHNDL